MKNTRFFNRLCLITVTGLLFLLISCGEKEIPIPLSEEKMIAVLIDMHMAESMIEKLPVLDRDTVGNVYYRMIYRTHGISKEDFDESISILREDPVRLNKVYSEILEQLNVLEATSRGGAGEME